MDLQIINHKNRLCNSVERISLSKALNPECKKRINFSYKIQMFADQKTHKQSQKARNENTAKI